MRPLGKIAIPPNGVIVAGWAIHTYRSAYPVVQALKYHRSTSLGRTMSRELMLFASKHNLLGPDDLVIPVPIHPRRRYERGFNQAEYLVRAFPAAQVQIDTLERHRYTKQQVGQSPFERSENVANAFTVNGDLGGRDVLLVDDVFTSGATARECAKTLLAAGAGSIQVLVYAGK